MYFTSNSKKITIRTPVVSLIIYLWSLQCPSQNYGYSDSWLPSPSSCWLEWREVCWHCTVTHRPIQHGYAAVSPAPWPMVPCPTASTSTFMGKAWRIPAWEEFNEKGGQIVLMGYLQSTAKQQPNIFLLDGNVCWAWQKEHLYQDFTHSLGTRPFTKSPVHHSNLCYSHGKTHLDTKSS